MSSSRENYRWLRLLVPRKKGERWWKVSQQTTGLNLPNCCCTWECRNVLPVDDRKATRCLHSTNAMKSWQRLSLAGDSKGTKCARDWVKSSNTTKACLPQRSQSKVAMKWADSSNTLISRHRNTSPPNAWIANTNRFALRRAKSYRTNSRLCNDERANCLMNAKPGLRTSLSAVKSTKIHFWFREKALINRRW